MDIEPGADGAHDPASAEWAEALARTVAHLAAQLTISQLRLRALATVLAEAGAVDPGAVRAALGEVAERSAGAYLRENLGEALEGVIDVEALAGQIRAFVARE